jgi:hypothetical protein
MSMSKAVPECLKNQECKKGNRKKRHPIPYVPIVDEVQEAFTKGKEYSNKIKLIKKTKFSIPIWTLGPRKPFSFTCSKQKVHVRGRGCSRTTLTPLRQNWKPRIMPRTSKKPSPMRQVPNLRRTLQLPTSPCWMS